MPTGFSKSLIAKRAEGSKFKIVDQTGSVLSNVTVTTDANPNINLTYNAGINLTYLLPPGQQVITATKAGYITKKTALNISGVIQISITLTEAADIQSTQTITDADTVFQTVTNTARAENNASVDLPPGAIVDSNGNPVSDVTVEITNVSVSDEGSADTFPGSFIGNDGVSTAPIESFGFMNVNLTDTNTGNPLELDPLIGATVRLPVDPDPVGVDSIPTYRLNESTGEWELEGTAYRIPGSNIFEFPVTSFSWWNLDQLLGVFTPMDCKILENDDDSTVNDDSTTYIQPIQPGEAPGRGVEVYVRRPNITPMFLAKGISDEQGVCVLDAVPGGFISVYGIKGNKIYDAADIFQQGGRLKTTLRPNGQYVSIGAELTANTFVVNEGNAFTFSLLVRGVALAPKAYTITGVDSSDISGAPLTGSINISESYLPGETLGVGRGNLTLTAGNVSVTKTLTLTLDNSIAEFGSVISRSVTILDRDGDAAKGTLSVAKDTTGTGNYYNLSSPPHQAGPGHKIRISLATQGIANTTLSYAITGDVVSNDISGAPLSGGFVLVNDGANRAYSNLFLTVNSGLLTTKTLILTVTYPDTTTDSVTITLTSSPGSE